MTYRRPLACTECGQVLPPSAQLDEDPTTVECRACRTVGPLEEAVNVGGGWT